ncbi:MAG TPA: RodZ domain-containing protein [Vicinamibacteria bacterium]|nr:RodZ domain-containing protein [Vicinamibacteria bacterium]
MASLGEKLRRERELRGISLKEIAQETKIGLHLLEALEEGRLDRIPGEFYGRSYLRAYARCLGLNEDQALNAYDHASLRKSHEAPDRVTDATKRKPSARMKWTLGVAALSLPALLWFRSEPVSRDENIGDPGARPPAAQPAPAEPEAPAVGSFVTDVDLRKSLSSGIETPVAAPLRVVLSVDDECWLEIVADGEVVASGLKERGFRSEFIAKDEVRLWLGNAGVVRLWLNDQPAKSLGRRNQVLRELSITRANYRQFVELS